MPIRQRPQFQCLAAIGPIQDEIPDPYVMTMSGLSR